MDKELNREEIAALESEEFNSLLEAVEMMAKAQGNLFHLTKAVSELQDLVDSGTDRLPQLDEALLSGILDSMQELVDDLANGEDLNTHR